MQQKYPLGVFIEFEDQLDFLYDEKKDKISKEELFKKLPKNYISDEGEILDIRKGIEN